MGTRAIISKDGKPFLATHWDGDPESLGKELERTRTAEQIISVARKHTIDSASPPVMKTLNAVRLRMLMRKHKLSLEEIKKGVRRGNIIVAEDYEIGNIKNYDDFAEYQYNLKNGKWEMRELHGEWKKAKAGKWKSLEKVV